MYTVLWRENGEDRWDRFEDEKEVKELIAGFVKDRNVCVGDVWVFPPSSDEDAITGDTYVDEIEEGDDDNSEKRKIGITVEKTLRLYKEFEATDEEIELLEGGENPFEDEFDDEEMENGGDISWDYSVADENGRTIVDWN